MAEIKIGEYIFRRLRELGIETVFGVPGDYELALLDFIPGAGLTWMGTPNELIGAYAADGYGRINGTGALITTFGPGETSALCGIAGSYTEFVPVVHIVGYPGIKVQAGTQILHHTLGDKKYDHFVKMSEQVSCASTVIMDHNIAAQKIDEMLNAMFYYSQPVYIGLPMDLVQMKISSAPLATKIVRTLPSNDSVLEERAVAAIIKFLKSSKKPIIISDGGATRHQVIEEVATLMEVSKLATFVTGMGKGSVNEQHPQFGGVYGGAATKPDVKEIIESADCVLWVGNYPSDFNTGEFTEDIKTEVTIDFQRFYVMVANVKYNVNMKYVLQKLAESLKKEPLSSTATKITWNPYPPLKAPADPDVKHDWLWQRFTTFLKSGDILITESGTAASGMNEAWLPKGVTMYSQLIFGSIGFATGSALGASIAGKEIGAPYKRLILTTGEGSLQLTIQTLSLIQRHGMSAIIFVINNGGYTVERLIHGIHEAYNDVPLWEYSAMLKAFGPGVESKSYKISKSAELDALMSDEAFNNSSYTQLVDLIMDPFDCPLGIKVIGQYADKHNAGLK